jgi:ketosteroid isomerase-like protein
MQVSAQANFLQEAVMHYRARISLFTCCLLVPLAMACARDADDTVPPPAAEPVGAPAPAPPATGQATMPPELTNRVQQYTSAWNGSDPAAVSAFFTDDATARVGDDSFSGRQEIQSGWLQNVPNINNLQINETRSEQRGQDFYSEGTYTHAPFQAPDGTSSTSGRYTVTWTRAADGQWRIRSTEVMPDA